MKRILLTLFAALSLQHAALATQIYSNGFETDVLGWNSATTRVPSGTAGVPSATGSFHAQDSDPSANNPFTGWGATVVPADGYNFGAGNNVGVPFQQYTTSVDVYLDMEAGMANDTRFDFTSAINNTSGAHRRDFAFNGGFYNAGDLGGPGGATNRFVFSGSNSTGRANSFPKNPMRDPVSVDQTGWYTLTHEFRDNGLGILEVELSLLDAASTLINSWLLTDPTDVIDVTVGGNRYGWFASNELGVLAIDNASMNVVPEPASIALVGLAVGGLGLIGRRRRRS
jgi:hypothetical protein